MSTTHIRTAVESFYEDIWNRRDKSTIPTLLSEDFMFRGSLGEVKTGREEFGAYVDFIHDALADYQCDILDLVIEETKAFARLRFFGIHRGEFFGYPPTGRLVEWQGTALFTFRDGKVADLWVLGDMHGLMESLARNALG